jgi:dimethylargininase
MRRFINLPTISQTSSNVVRRYYGAFRKGYAFTRDIDESLKTAALTLNVANQKTIDLRKARIQHENLTNELRNLGLEIHNLPSDGFADSVFIEDTCVIIDEIAMITLPGAKSRQGEIEAVRKYLKNFTRGQLVVTDLKEGTVDGGDVLFTGT